MSGIRKQPILCQRTARGLQEEEKERVQKLRLCLLIFWLFSVITTEKLIQPSESNQPF